MLICKSTISSRISRRDLRNPSRSEALPATNCNTGTKKHLFCRSIGCDHTGGSSRFSPRGSSDVLVDRLVDTLGDTLTDGDVLGDGVIDVDGVCVAVSGVHTGDTLGVAFGV